MKKIIVIFALLLFKFSNSSADDTLTIGNTSLTGNKITKTEIRSLYLMRTRRLFNGDVVILYQFRDDDPIHIDFVRKVLGMTADQYKEEHAKAAERNTAISTIRYVNSKSDMFYRVSITPNSIGYMDSSRFMLYSDDANVKLLNIEN